MPEPAAGCNFSFPDPASARGGYGNETSMSDKELKCTATMIDFYLHAN